MQRRRAASLRNPQCSMQPADEARAAILSGRPCTAQGGDRASPPRGDVRRQGAQDARGPLAQGFQGLRRARLRIRLHAVLWAAGRPRTFAGTWWALLRCVWPPRLLCGR